MPSQGAAPTNPADTSLGPTVSTGQGTNPTKSTTGGTLQTGNDIILNDPIVASPEDK